MRKRLLLLLTALSLLLLPLSACGSGEEAAESAQTEAVTTETAARKTETPSTHAVSTTTSPGAKDETPETSDPESSAEPTETAGTEESSILIVYFSATGNTAAVAETIAEYTGADLFALEAADPYTEDDLNWEDADSRVSQEYADESKRVVELVSTEVENWSEYDVVLIGYPIWWGYAAWPVNSFVRANDFSGKRVIPFCTSSSSGIGETVVQLAELAGSGNWEDGVRFPEEPFDEDVLSWVDSLELP